MAAFEFGNYPERPGRAGPGARGVAGPAPAAPTEGPAFGASEHAVHRPKPDPERLRSEPLLALKIYDSCRHKNCLGPSDIGPARYVEGTHQAGRPVVPPEDARSVSIEDLRVRRIVIASKEPSKFKDGYWNLEIRYVFDYHLRFMGNDGVHLETIPATNSFTRRLSLFGSVGAEITMATDLFKNAETIMGGEPFVMVEAKALGLAAEITRKHCPGDDPPPHVNVTIGLFSIIKLYRMVSLLVESRGFVIPPACKDICPVDPCDFFNDLSFPMDSFAPPQKPEFMAGVSGDIPNEAIAADGEEILE